MPCSAEDGGEEKDETGSCTANSSLLTSCYVLDRTGETVSSESADSLADSSNSKGSQTTDGDSSDSYLLLRDLEPNDQLNPATSMEFS